MNIPACILVVFMVCMSSVDCNNNITELQAELFKLADKSEKAFISSVKSRLDPDCVQRNIFINFTVLHEYLKKCYLEFRFSVDTNKAYAYEYPYNYISEMCNSTELKKCYERVEAIVSVCLNTSQKEYYFSARQAFDAGLRYVCTYSARRLYQRMVGGDPSGELCEMTIHNAYLVCLSAGNDPYWQSEECVFTGYFKCKKNLGFAKCFFAMTDRCTTFTLLSTKKFIRNLRHAIMTGTPCEHLTENHLNRKDEL